MSVLDRVIRAMEKDAENIDYWVEWWKSSLEDTLVDFGLDWGEEDVDAIRTAIEYERMDTLDRVNRLEKLLRHLPEGGDG